MLNPVSATPPLSTAIVTPTLFLSPPQTQTLTLTQKWRIPSQLSQTPTSTKKLTISDSNSPIAVNNERIFEGNSTKERVFLLDVNPICYKGSNPSLRAFATWISLFFSQVTLNHPVIAVIDGEGGHEHRKQILPSYKAHRMKFVRRVVTSRGLPQHQVGTSHQIVANFLRNCNVPVLRIEGQEADDVIASLTKRALDRGNRVVIASPDKDFKQLISEEVQLVIPMPELGRWSFYTSKHYNTQYDCDPQSDLSLRCILGDEVDGVPGIQTLVPGFGRKTAIKLLKKHGSLENLLNAAAVRTVGKQYVQDALTKYASELRRNYQVLALKRDIDVQIQDEWLSERDSTNDSVALTELYKLIGEG